MLVFLTDITLLVIDECHGTNKDSVYNKVMALYLEKKLKGQQPLPQILGLTASPGTGGAKILDRAVEHVLQVRIHLITLVQLIRLISDKLSHLHHCLPLRFAPTWTQPSFPLKSIPLS